MKATRATASGAALLLLAAVSSGAVVAQDGLGAMEAFPPGMVPRWYPGSSDPILKRQDVVNCDPGTHSCLDVNSTTICCPNDRYCYVNPAGDIRCCAIGLLCDSQCEAGKYRCNSLRVVTSGTAAPVTSTLAACCDRRCKTTSQFLCPSSLGGGCCGYGAVCAIDPADSARGNCRVTQTQRPSDLVTPVPEGCSAGQITCASSIGGGCCAVGRACTQVSSTAFCVTAPVVVTDPAIVAVPQSQGSGLSTGATAGIAVGVVLGAAAVLGAATFLCIRRRRGRYSSVSQSAVGEVGRHGSTSIPVIVGGTSRRESELGGTAPGPVSGSASDVRGPTTDYFGPDAVVGPYTDTGVEARDTTPGYERGVPAAPHGPSDIVAPVELGPSGRQSPLGSVASPTASEHPSQLDGRQLAPPNQRVHENTDGRFELYGSEVTPPSQGAR